VTDKLTVHQALVKVMEDVRAVRKGDRNTQQGYLFRGIDAVMNAVGPALRKHGVIVAPVTVETHYRDVQTSTGKPSRECTLLATYRFYGPAGDHLDVMAPGEAMDFGDKGTPKAMSVAMRTALLQALCLPTDEPEPDATTYERAERTKEPTGAPTGADMTRSQIREWADANNYDPAVVMKDFHHRMRSDIREAAVSDLHAYLEHVKANGIEPEVPLESEAEAKA